MTKDAITKGEVAEQPICGVVMPISQIDGCSEEHWKDVFGLLSEAIRAAEYEPNLVSNDADIGVIHKRIVQNLYVNPIVVCDVSGRNPNVMFELGMRLAFDKPVIIVKDDKTPYSFDTSPVEHLTYPRDLRYGAILEFKARLSEKIRTCAQNKNSFLSSFGSFKVAKIQEESADAFDIVLEEMGSLKSAIMRLEARDRAVRTASEDNFRVVPYYFNNKERSDQKQGSFRFLTFNIDGTHTSRDRFTGSLKAFPFVKDVNRSSSDNTEDRLAVLISSSEYHDDVIFERISSLAKKHSLALKNFNYELMSNL